MARVVLFPSAIKAAARSNLPEILQAKLAAAQSAAQSMAPHDTGAYAGSFEIRIGAWAGWVVNTDPGARAIEFGARGGANPRFRVLGRATDALGGGV